MGKNNTKYLIDGKTSKWEVVIGLEVHAQVSSNSKLFSYASKRRQSNRRYCVSNGG